MTALEQSELVRLACATKDLDPALVTDVRLTDTDIFLMTEVLGEIRVERSALPEGVPFAVELVQPPVHAEQEPTFSLPGVPTNTLAALVEAGYTNLDSIDAARDEALLEVDGVGQAMLKRIRVQRVLGERKIDLE